jgi:polyisoprenoid-binding protein YceI
MLPNGKNSPSEATKEPTMTTTSTNTLVRDVDGAAAPPAGTYAIDHSHTTLEFVARHLMITKVRGRFNDYDGSVVIGEGPEDSSIEVSVDLSSVDTNDPKRDEHLRSADFFEIDKHPKMTFKSTKFEPAGDGWKVTGDLTIRNVSRPLTLDVEFEGASTTPWNTSAYGFSASGEIDRENWGVSWNAALETGGVVVGKKVKIELNVELVPAS